MDGLVAINSPDILEALSSHGQPCGHEFSGHPGGPQQPRTILWP